MTLFLFKLKVYYTVDYGKNKIDILS